MTKRVPENERLAISADISALLAEDDGSRRRVWTQTSLAARLSVAQETVRQAMRADGVTPVVKTALLKFRQCTMAELLARHSVRPGLFGVPELHPLAESTTQDLAIELLVRAGQPLRRAARAVTAAAAYTASEKAGPHRLARIAGAMIDADCED